jgi:hypothetical protein
VQDLTALCGVVVDSEISFFFLEYAKDLRIIAFKKEKYLSYKRRASSALGGLTSGPT